MILSAFCSTLFGYFAKSAMESIHLPLMVFLRFFVPFLLMIPYLFKHSESLRKIHYLRTGKHVLRAVAVVISQAALLYYFTRASLTDGVLLWNTAPLFMPIISVIFLKYKTSATVWLSILVSFVGVICIVKPTTAVFDPFSIYGFLSGLFVAISQVLYGVNRENETLEQNIFLFFLYTSILTATILFISLYISGFGPVVQSSFYEKGVFLPVLAVIAVAVGTIGNQVLRGMAFKYAKPSSLGPLTYLAVLFSALIDFFLQPDEIRNFVFFVGIVLIFLGTIIKIVHTAKA